MRRFLIPSRISLLLLGVIVIPWLPILEPSRDATPARRVRGVGDVPILGFALAPDGATIATIQVDGRVALRDAAWGRGIRRFSRTRRTAHRSVHGGPPGREGTKKTKDTATRGFR